MKLRLLTSAIFIGSFIAGFGQAQAAEIRFQLDPTASGIAGVTGIDGDGTTPSMDQMGFNAASSITVTDTGGDGFTTGDTFVESGTFGISSYINLPGTTISPVNLNSNYQIFGDFTGIGGSVTNIIPDANPATGADGVFFDFDSLGTLEFKIDNFVAGGEVTIATASVVAGQGNVVGDFGLGAAASNAGFAEQGSIDLTFEFDTLLDEFWLFEDGSDIEDFLSMPFTLVLGLIDMNVDNTSTIVGGVPPVLFELGTTHNGSVSISTIPEPSVLALLGIGLLGAAGVSRRKKS